MNTGDVSGDVAPKDGRGGFAAADPDDAGGIKLKSDLGDEAISLPYDDPGDGRCRVALRLMPPYLLATENDRCGGFNVSFTGVYRDIGPKRNAPGNAPGVRP